jgi:hypothetical protein
VKVEKYGPVPGFEFEASGKTVTTFLFAAALFAFGFFHDWKSEHEHDRMSEAQALTASLIATSICVNTLNEAEKRDFRVEGKYCHDALREVREYLRRQDALPEKHGARSGSVYAAEPHTLRSILHLPDKPAP